MKFIASFNLPDQVDRNDLATALDYHLGRAYDLMSSDIDTTIWTEKDHLEDLLDLAAKNLLEAMQEQLEEERTLLLRNRKARQVEEFDPDCVGDEDYPYKSAGDFKRQQHDDVLWLRAMHGANVNFRAMLRDLRK